MYTNVWRHKYHTSSGRVNSKKSVANGNRQLVELQLIEYLIFVLEWTIPWLIRIRTISRISGPLRIIEKSIVYLLCNAINDDQIYDIKTVALLLRKCA